MSETRQAYNVALRPGRELDIQVMRVMHRVNVASYPDLAVYSEAIDSGEDAPPFSTNPTVAMGAWEWLEENHPWKYSGADKATILLGRNIPGKPSVLVMCDYWDGGIPTEAYYSELGNFHIPGTTYPHAVALAVVEAGRALGQIDSKHNL